MGEKNIVKLEYVPINELWEKEDKNFTPWLKEHIEYLNDILIFEIQVEESEVRQAEGFQVDLLGSDIDGNKVIIENQFGQSDHKHLGQTLVYCITLEAKIAIWICEKARQSHIEVIEWLNENCPDDMGFYLIQLKLGKINENYIPIFEIIVKPSDEATIIGNLKKDLSDIKWKYYEFWKQFTDKARDQAKIFENLGESNRQYIGISIGKGLSYAPNMTRKEIRTELYIDTGNKSTNKLIYDELFNQKEKIEQKFGDNLDWQRLDERNASRVRYTIKNIDWRDKNNWDEIHELLIKNTIKLEGILREPIKNISF